MAINNRAYRLAREIAGSILLWMVLGNFVAHVLKIAPYWAIAALMALP